MEWRIDKLVQTIQQDERDYRKETDSARAAKLKEIIDQDKATLTRSELIAFRPDPVQAQPAPLPQSSPAALPSVVTENSSDLIDRFYILTNLTHPEDLLERGVREYIVDEMRGLSIGGSIRRAFDDKFDKHLRLHLCGSRKDVQDAEDRLLHSQYWSAYNYSETSLKSHFNPRFTIIKSTRGAKKRRNSI